MSVFIRQALFGEKIRVFGDGRQIRDFNYIDDVIDALLLAAAGKDCNGEIFNLGGDEPMMLVDFVKLLLDIAGTGDYEIVPFPPEKKRIDIGDYYADYRKIKAALGWRYNVNMRDGLEKSLDFYKQFGDYYW